MKVGIVSDTHGNLSGFLDALDFLRGTHKVEKLFFLGHNYKDVERVVEVKRALKAAKNEDEDSTGFVTDLYEMLAKREGLAGPRTARSELDEAQWLKKQVVRVPGDDEPEAMFGGDINTKEFEMVGGRIVCLVHNPKSLAKEDVASANLVVYGHTHLHQVDKVGGRYFCNPGHLQDKKDNGRDATFAVLDIGDDCKFSIFGLDNNLVQELALEMDVKRKFSAT